MRTHDHSIFLNKDDRIYCHMQKEYPKLIRITPNPPSGTPTITIFVENREQFMTFKNSVIQAYEKLLREANNANT